MPIQFQCECGKSYKVDDKYAGRSITCKACGDPLTVPKGRRSSGGKKASSGGGAGPPRLPGKAGTKKKKKKPGAASPKASSSNEPALSPKVIAILVVPVVLVLGGIGYGVYKVSTSSGDGGGEAAAPVQMAKYKSEHGSFSIDYPEDWTSNGGGGTGGKPPWATFETGDAYFSIRASISGSAIGDIAGAGAGGDSFGAEETPEELEPVAKVHEFQKDKMKVDYGDYEETPANKIEVPYGEGRISTFTGDEGLFGSNVKGYRMTLLGTNHQYNVIAKCPENQWDDYKDTFQQMIESIGR